MSWRVGPGWNADLVRLRVDDGIAWSEIEVQPAEAIEIAKALIAAAGDTRPTPRIGW